MVSVPLTDSSRSRLLPKPVVDAMTDATILVFAAASGAVFVQSFWLLIWNFLPYSVAGFWVLRELASVFVLRAEVAPETPDGAESAYGH